MDCNSSCRSSSRMTLIFTYILIACSATSVLSTKVTTGTTSNRIKKRTGKQLFVKKKKNFILFKNIIISGGMQ